VAATDAAISGASFNPEPAATPARVRAAQSTALGRDDTPGLAHRRDRK
jgi:hypothetical protein